MKQTERTLAVLDIGSSTIKGLLGSLSEDRPTGKEKLFFDLQGAITQTRGISKKGVIHSKAAFSRSIAEVLATLSNTSGYEVRSVHLLFTHPRTQCFTKQTGSNAIKHPQGIFITRDWLEKKKELILSHIARRHPQYTCTYFSIISLVADGEEILYDPFEYTASRSLFLTYRYTISPTVFIEGLREAVERTATVESCTPSGVALDCFLSPQQRERGVLVCSIGAQFTTLSSFSDGVLSNVRTLPFGGALLTDEIALMRRIALEEAETLKRSMGERDPSLTKKDVQSITKKVTTRVKEELLSHIRDIKKEGTFPGGILLFGGGAQYTTMDTILERVTGLRVAYAPVLQKVQSHKSFEQILWQSSYGLLHQHARSIITALPTAKKERSMGKLVRQWLQRIAQLFS